MECNLLEFMTRSKDLEWSTFILISFVQSITNKSFVNILDFNQKSEAVIKTDNKRMSESWALTL